jgi:hypothetical protein
VLRPTLFVDFEPRRAPTAPDLTFSEALRRIRAGEPMPEPDEKPNARQRAR